MWLRLRDTYERLITERAVWVVFWTVLLVLFLGYQARHFSLDASAESLLLESDEELERFRTVSERYQTQEFLVLTFTPNEPLFSDAVLDTLTELRNDIQRVEGIESVTSLMDVPLLANPPVPMTELVDNIKTLENPKTDLEMARKELANSPLYSNLLLNLDANTTALQIKFPRDTTREQLVETREALREQRADKSAEFDERQLEQVNRMLRQHDDERQAQIHSVIQNVRDIRDDYSQYGELHLGGVPMIADDLIRFIRNDLTTFGLAVFFLLVAILTVIFRQPRWVIMPLLCCTAVVVSMLGILGWGRWPVTVISSNFVSLLLILTLSMAIHLIVRYRELLRLHDDWDQRRLVTLSVRRVAVPCIYMALTTGVAFVSLILSNIRPVINFGWMMASGIACAFILTFVLFPALLMLLPKDRSTAETRTGEGVTRLFAHISVRWGNSVLLASVLLAALTIAGITRLSVENSFIDYFDESTEIYQGMKFVDQNLGGTTPLEVLINFQGDALLENRSDQSAADAFGESSGNGGSDDAQDPDDAGNSSSNGSASSDATDSGGFGGGGGDFVEEDLFKMESGASGGFADESDAENPEKYWFTERKVSRIKALHRYLDEQPETGKVLSLATMTEIAESFNDGEPLTNVQLALLYTVIPEEFRDLVIEPYVSVEHNQARVNVRILDSLEGLDRDAFLQRVRDDSIDQLGFEPDQVQLTGIMVLYNNMLQSLFESQILTLGAVFAGILLMFWMLFRNLTLSFIAMAPNLLAATFVLGIMGWVGIPLDMMTITIASITIGIAVDNTIHYIVRYRLEFDKDHDYIEALHRSHNSIGKAIFYTSLTIILGFSVLSLSNFRPTIYFGLLTALAMGVALVGAMTLLPRLIVVIKPFGNSQPTSQS